jgi:hypothetical protein
MQRKILAIPPRSSTVAISLQPDYRKWESIKPGMPRTAVSAILGPPLSGREQRPGIAFWTREYPAYGFIAYPALPDKWAMLFTVGFDAQDRVLFKADPFGGATLSRTGRPSKARIITPLAGSRFSHYPRILDIRWFPCSGVYPIAYELEIGVAQPGSGRYNAHLDPRQIGQPFAMVTLPGAQPARVRVRGRNACGVGPWSDYAEFLFEV